MATAVKKCRICGKDYEACRSVNKTAGVFRWQEVACSPECGAEYLRRVTESRNPAPHVLKQKGKRKTVVALPVMNEATVVQIDSAESADETSVEEG